MACRLVAIVARVDEQNVPPDASQAAQRAEAGRATTNNDGIVVRLRDVDLDLTGRGLRNSSTQRS
jgi:hypothetical protein